VSPSMDNGRVAPDVATSRRMAGIRREGTKPELQVRKLLTSLGLRYRTRNRDLPGSPDLANRTHHWAVFVHGCFWHAHPRCRYATVPLANREHWVRKFEDNVQRDRRAVRSLRAKGFLVLVVWECELRRSPTQVLRRLSRFGAQVRGNRDS